MKELAERTGRKNPPRKRTYVANLERKREGRGRMEKGDQETFMKHVNNNIPVWSSHVYPSSEA